MIKLLIVLSFSIILGCSSNSKKTNELNINTNEINTELVACDYKQFLYFDQPIIKEIEYSYDVFNNIIPQEHCFVKMKGDFLSSYNDQSKKWFIMCNMNEGEFEFHGLHFIFLKDAKKYIQAVNNKGHLFNFPRLHCKFFSQKTDYME